MSADCFNTDDGDHNLCIELVMMLFRKINIESAHPCLYLWMCTQILITFYIKLILFIFFLIEYSWLHNT